MIIPSFTYLEERLDQIVAIIITHGHDDAMAALPYLLQSVNVPIYAPNLTANLIEQMMERFQRHNRVKIAYDLRRVKRNASLDIAGVPVEFFPVTHSIPGLSLIHIFKISLYDIISTGDRNEKNCSDVR